MHCFSLFCPIKDGLTALHCAARSGHDLVVDILLEYGASVTAKTRNGLTALHMASQGDHVDTARMLLFHKAPIDEVTVVCVIFVHHYLQQTHQLDALTVVGIKS